MERRRIARRQRPRPTARGAGRAVRM